MTDFTAQELNEITEYELHRTRHWNYDRRIADLDRAIENEGVHPEVEAHLRKVFAEIEAKAQAEFYKHSRGMMMGDVISS